MEPFSIELLVLFMILIALICILIVLTLFNQSINYWIQRHKKVRKESKSMQQLSYFINNFASSLVKMSYDKIGAIIIIENKDNLDRYINSGKKVIVDLFPEFVVNIFYNHKSPLHDGAMIIRDLRIVSLSSYLPTTNKILPVNYGARHRAGFGICEHFDCYSFIVSETTGDITYAHLGEIHKLSNSIDELIHQIIAVLSLDSIYAKILNH